jgi:hypothetical protein
MTDTLLDRGGSKSQLSRTHHSHRPGMPGPPRRPGRPPARHGRRVLRRSWKPLRTARAAVAHARRHAQAARQRYAVNPAVEHLTPHCKRSAVPRQDHQTALPTTGSHCDSLAPSGTGPPRTAGPGHVPADVLECLRHLDAVLIKEPTRCLDRGRHLVAQAARDTWPWWRSNSTAVTTSPTDIE